MTVLKYVFSPEYYVYIIMQCFGGGLQEAGSGWYSTNLVLICFA